MVRRIPALILGVGVLAATGVASGTPCCTLTQLSRQPSAELRDCCDEPDCCRVEKQGPAQAALLTKAPDGLSRAALLVTHLLPAGGNDQLSRFHLGIAVAATDRPPPLAHRDTLLLISLLRV